MRRAESSREPRRERDLGRLVARVLCALFALIGALPLLGGILVRSPPVLAWAADETSRVLQEQLGVTASYRVTMQFFPLQLALLDVEVPSTDGGSPALVAERIAVTPRIFSLLAGRLDVGDIEIDHPRTRVVVRDGKLANLAYRLPETQGPAPELRRPPFTSLGVTDAEIELDIEGVVVSTGPVDLDVFAEHGPKFELALRAGQMRLERRRPVTLTAGNDSVVFEAHDEDVLCRLDLRAHLSKTEVLIRRLSLLGAADSNPLQGTRPGCAAQDDAAENRVALRLSQLRIVPRSGQLPEIHGHVFARGPAGITNRFVSTLPISGWVGFSGDVRYDGSTTLPELRGKLRGKNLQFDVYRLAKHLEVEVELSGDRILVPRFEMGFAEGRVVLQGGVIEPLAPGAPITARQVDSQDIDFSAMMRDLGVTPDTIVGWDLTKTHITKVRGTFVPLKIDAEMSGESRDFAVYDRAYHSPARKRMIGVRAASVRGRMGVRPKALEFYDTRASFGKSVVLAPLVSIGFKNDIALSVSKGTKIELADVSPLVDIPWAGSAELTATMGGKMSDPLLTGELSIAKFEFGGFPVGELKSAKLRFSPLKLDLHDAVGKKGRSNYRVPSARLAFDAGSSVLVDARVQSQDFDVRDFFAMFHFDQDPRFDPIHGLGNVDARIHYDLGGRRDRCGGGYLSVDGKLDLRRVELFEERYDSARADFQFRWLDREASYLGVELDVPSLMLSKGSGSMLGSLSMRPGGRVNGHLVATGVPVSRIDALGSMGGGLDARLSGVGEVSGSVDELEVTSSVRMSPLALGGTKLPASELSVLLEPKRRSLKTIGKTRCGAPVTPPFNRADYDRDESQGTFRVSGRLFGQQVKLEGLEISRQRKKRVRGKLAFSGLDLGALSELAPPLALSSSRPRGKLSGRARIDELSMDDPAAASARFEITELSIEHAGTRLGLEPNPEPITVAGRRLSFPRLSVGVRTASGQRAVFDLHGHVSRLGAGSDVDATLMLRPMQLATLTAFIPRAERASGTLKGSLKLTGPASRLGYQGGFRLENGEIFVRGLPSSISDLQLAVAVDSGELRITKASAKVGSGSITMQGSAPLRGFQLGAARIVMRAKQLALPLEHGVKATVDANLVATWAPPSDSDRDRSLPRVTGDVSVRSFEYTRPVTMTADISSLAQRGRRTEFEAYDPADDFVEFDVTLRAQRALQISNNLVEAELLVDKKGLLLAGTNQRFGMRGELRLKQGGRIRLRQSEFEIRQGHVRFDDLTRVAPLVDVTAVTEYRRYSESETREATTAGGSGTGGTTAAGGGRWLITMHAHGDADKLKIDLTSDPALAQDDVFLLLTVGLTRAELDQSQSASVGESVALEALGTLSGADRAVTQAVPVIDEFRFGSAYSSRTGRTEPTVTIGKRLAKRIRANITSGVAESREIRSNVEWRLSPRVSVEGSYDNVNDISSSQLGNLGADVRWRLEFE
jgi:translocation and assembly module TamB